MKGAPQDEEKLEKLHIQMCKKVAQLTKVIYHLNTKLDEHDTEIEMIKNDCEEEIDAVAPFKSFFPFFVFFGPNFSPNY